MNDGRKPENPLPAAAESSGAGRGLLPSLALKLGAKLSALMDRPIPPELLTDPRR